MRSRCHVLIAIRSFADIIVCVYLIQVRAEILVGNTFMKSRQCVPRVAYGLVFENLQCSIGLALGVDRLLAIVTPVQYRKWPARQYLLLLLVPCCIFSLVLASFALWESSGESRVAICFTPSAYINRAKMAWTKLNTDAQDFTFPRDSDGHVQYMLGFADLRKPFAPDDNCVR
uniref:G-protein coupled receptors family 1 profile domain-containing protein n=1 Tax=Plectus sambesii TaxID=2011161 RepID=A0A914WB80_9BILA